MPLLPEKSATSSIPSTVVVTGTESLVTTAGSLARDNTLVANSMLVVPSVVAKATASNAALAGVVLPNRLLQMPFQVAYAKFISGDFIPKGRSFVLIAELSSERLAVGYAKTSLDMVSEPPVRWTACHLSGLHVLLCMCYRGQAEGICGPNGPCGR